MQNEEKSDTPKEKACSKSCRRKITDVVFSVHSGGLAILRFRSNSVPPMSAAQPAQRRIGLFRQRQALCPASVSEYI